MYAAEIRANREAELTGLTTRRLADILYDYQGTFPAWAIRKLKRDALIRRIIRIEFKGRQ